MNSCNSTFWVECYVSLKFWEIAELPILEVLTKPGRRYENPVVSTLKNVIL